MRLPCPGVTPQRLLPHYEGSEYHSTHHPVIGEIADYSETTRGVWFGAWRDILKAKALVSIQLRSTKQGAESKAQSVPPPSR
mgnify:FL=1